MVQLLPLPTLFFLKCLFYLLSDLLLLTGKKSLQPEPLLLLVVAALWSSTASFFPLLINCRSPQLARDYHGAADFAGASQWLVMHIKPLLIEMHIKKAMQAWQNENLGASFAPTV